MEKTEIEGGVFLTDGRHKHNVPFLLVCFMVLLTIEWHDHTATLCMFHVCCETGLFGTVRSVWCGILSNPPFVSAGASIFTPTEPCESDHGVLWQKRPFTRTFYLHQMFTFLVSCWKRCSFPHGDGWEMDLCVCATSYLVKDFLETDVVLVRRGFWENCLAWIMWLNLNNDYLIKNKAANNSDDYCPLLWMQI